MELSATNKPEHRQSLLWSMNLSLVIGVLMLFMKVGAYWLTGSAAILSDAAESIVHVAAVAFRVIQSATFLQAAGQEPSLRPLKDRFSPPALKAA